MNGNIYSITPATARILSCGSGGYEGKLTSEKLITKAATNIAIPKLFKRFDDVMKPAEKAGVEIFSIGLDRTLDEGRKNNWEPEY